MLSICHLRLFRPPAPLPSERGADVRPYGRALEMCGGFLVVIGANSFGHLPGLSPLACVLLWSGLADHSVEGRSATRPPGKEPAVNKHTAVTTAHLASALLIQMKTMRLFSARFQRIKHGWIVV